jgi:hypothetical protein
MQVFQDVRDGPSSSGGGGQAQQRPRPYLRQVSEVRSYLQRSDRSSISDELTRQLMWPAAVSAALPSALLGAEPAEGEAPEARPGSAPEDAAVASTSGRGAWQHFTWQSSHTRVQHGTKARSKGFSMRSAVAHELLPDQRGGPPPSAVVLWCCGAVVLWVLWCCGAVVLCGCCGCCGCCVGAVVLWSLVL